MCGPTLFVRLRSTCSIVTGCNVKRIPAIPHTVPGRMGTFFNMSWKDGVRKNAQPMRRTPSITGSMWELVSRDVYAKRTKYGIEKGIAYSKALGGSSDATRKHSTVIFPLHSNGQCGRPAKRIPDSGFRSTTLTRIIYVTRSTPLRLALKRRRRMWSRGATPPLHDENGQPILDYVLAQDALVWRGPRRHCRRSQEILGRTDVPIVLLRRQLEEQISLVEQGQDPMNFFPEQSEEILYGSGAPPVGWTSPDMGDTKVEPQPAVSAELSQGLFDG